MNLSKGIVLLDFVHISRANGALNAVAINASDGTIPFKSFTDGNIINLDKLLSYLNSKMNPPVSKPKLKKIQPFILQDMKK